MSVIRFGKKKTLYLLQHWTGRKFRYALLDIPSVKFELNIVSGFFWISALNFGIAIFWE